ncbi:MAG TPA: hypothetical protein VHU18_05035 [Rhizomicrobium sp.]|nr:hypothetical protein [Rhizomicrobium sp.]
MPFDAVASILVPLFAAFFGALAAFTLSWLERREQVRQTRREMINRSAYSLIITSNTLLNFKRQFLFEYLAEFQKAYTILQAMNVSGDTSYYRSLFDKVSIVFTSVAWQDQQLNGLLKPLEEIQFLQLSAADDLMFTVEGDTDLVRLLLVVQTQLHQISKRLVERNAERKRLVDASQFEIANAAPGRASLMFYFEMLDARKILSEYVNLALVLIEVATERLDSYRKKHFKGRTQFLQWLLGRERWTTTYTIPAGWKYLIPDRKDYSDVIDGVRAN